MKPKLLYTVSARYSDKSLNELSKYYKLSYINNINELKKELPYAHALITSLENEYSSNLFKNATNLKYIISNTTGINHINLFKGTDIELIYLKDSSVLSELRITAELAITLMFALIRNLRKNIDSVNAGEWDRYNSPGSSFSGKKLGIIGMGRLGGQVADFCKYFGMNVSYFDPYIGTRKYTKIESLNELVSDSDIISVHCRLTKETRNMLNFKVFSKFKKGSIIVNTSRGEVINESDLIKALEEGIISGAGLDVLSFEQNNQGTSPILDYSRNNNNVIITPHIGGACVEAREFTEKIVIDDLLSKNRSI